MAKIKIDGFKLYKKTDDGDVFVADIEKTVRTKEFFRTMAIGTYGISAYRVVADVIDPSKSSVVESIKRYFDVNPFYRVIIKDTITETDKVTVTWTNETNINYIDGYEVFRVNETESGMTYELVDTITSPEATEYVFMRDDDTTYTYVISPKTYEGFHDADSSYIEVMFASIPPVMLIEPTDAVIYTARWKYDGDDGYDPDHDWKPEPEPEPEPEPIELPANTFRFQWENPIASPATDGRFTLSQVDERTWDYTVLDEYVNYGDLFRSKFVDLNNKVRLIAVGDISSIINMRSMFQDCSSLESVPLFDTSNATSMNSMFYCCTSLTTVPLFDTSNVTDMEYMFVGCPSFTSVPLFDTSNVTNMNSMFHDCTSLTTVPLFDTKNVIYMGNMFLNCIKVESGAFALYQQANATGKVTSHNNTFLNCGKDTETGLTELQQIPEDWGGLGLADNTLLVEIVDSDAARNWIETNYNSGTFSYNKVSDTQYKITNTDTNWTRMFDDSVHSGSQSYLYEILAAGDTSSIINMNNMFRGCTALTTVPLFDTSNVIYMEGMFRDCTSLTAVPLFDTSNVTYMPAMFYGCISLTTVPLFDTSNVTNMSEMFAGCNSLTSVPLFDTSNVVDMNGMFGGCESLTAVPLFDTSNVTKMDSMFYGCAKVESGASALYQQASATGKVRNHNGTFRNCGSATQSGSFDLLKIPSSWK